MRVHPHLRPVPAPEESAQVIPLRKVSQPKPQQVQREEPVQHEPLKLTSRQKTILTVALTLFVVGAWVAVFLL